MAKHVELMLEFQKRGAVAFDYGNNIRQVAFNNGVKALTSQALYQLTLDESSGEARDCSCCVVVVIQDIEARMKKCAFPRK